VYPDEESLNGFDVEEWAHSIRPWLAWKASVADTPSDDSRPDHARAV
jgi:hypothetical protein